MTLSTRQLQSISDGEPVDVTIEGTRCVVIRHDIYERVSSVFDPSPRESYAAVLKALDKDDESPEQYLEYLNE